MLQQGEWEQLDSLESVLLPALEAARTPAPGNQPGRQQIEQLLRKLELTIQACSNRKEQIAPLVEALSVTERSPAKP